MLWWLPNHSLLSCLGTLELPVWLKLRLELRYLSFVRL